MEDLEDEAITILTKLKIENYFKFKDRKVTISYSDLIDLTIKTIKLIEDLKKS